MDKRKVIMIITVVGIIAVVVGIIVLVLIGDKRSYDEYVDSDIQLNNTADELLLEYKKNDGRVTTNDMSNGNKTVDEINAEYEKSMNSGKSNPLSKVSWSYFDTEWVADTERLDSDEYGYIMNYVLNLDVDFKKKEITLDIPNDYSYISFDYSSNGRNANYMVIYNNLAGEIYVYAYIL